LHQCAIGETNGKRCVKAHEQFNPFETSQSQVVLELRPETRSIKRIDRRTAAQLDEKLANNPQSLGFDKRNSIELCARRRHVMV
jgi:hypothetical protein